MTSEDTFNQESPATDGRHVVWQSRQSDNTSDILWYDLVSGESGAVPGSAGSSEVNPAVDWPWVVYQSQPADNPSAPWQVMAWNHDTGVSFKVFPGVGDQFRPRVHAGRAVWEDHRDVGPGEIYLCDLETFSRRRITNNTYGQNNPVIFGDVIAWQDNRNSQVDIYMFDLLKGVEERVTDTPYNEINPELVGWWLMYQEDSLGPLTENFRLRDIQTGSAVSLTRAETQHSSGTLGNGFAVWTEQLGGNQSQAVASLLPGLQPVSVKANALAVTQALVERFGTSFALLNDWGEAAGITSLTRYESFDPLVAETATRNGSTPQGDDFALVAGSFLWVEFGSSNMADLGPGGDNTLDLASGLNAFSHAGFPIGATAYKVIEGIGAANIRSIRFFDAFGGRWRSVELGAGGARIGGDFAIPRVATVLLDMVNPVTAWKP